MVIEKDGEKIKDYRLLFSTKKNGQPTFPVLCREDELNVDLLAKIQEYDTLPQRAESDEVAMKDYEGQQNYDKNVLEWAHGTGRAKPMRQEDYRKMLASIERTARRKPAMVPAP